MLASAAAALLVRSADHPQGPLTKEIITWINNSPYGHKGRLHGGDTASIGCLRPPAEMRDEADVHSTQCVPIPVPMHLLTKMCSRGCSTLACVAPSTSWGSRWAAGSRLWQACMR